MDKATYIFTKLAKDVSTSEAAKVIKSRHSGNKSKASGSHKSKVLANVIGSSSKTKKTKIDFNAVNNAIKNKTYTAHADTTYHPNKTIKSITHTVAYPNKSGKKISVHGTKRSWNNQVTAKGKTWNTGASIADAKKSHNKSL